MFTRASLPTTQPVLSPAQLSRSQKEVIALGVSLSNKCLHCAYIHTAMGAAAGSDVPFDDMQRFYQTGDPDIAFPLSEGKDPLNHNLASWAIKHRNGKEAQQPVPCSVRNTLISILWAVALLTTGALAFIFVECTVVGFWLLKCCCLLPLFANSIHPCHQARNLLSVRFSLKFLINEHAVVNIFLQIAP